MRDITPTKRKGETMKTIHMTIEKYDGQQGEYYTMSITGDTYDAKETIKSLGYNFSDQIGYGKAWRLPIIVKSDMIPGNTKLAEFQSAVKNTVETLKGAGYNVIQHR
jgi:hypothetical protein